MAEGGRDISDSVNQMAEVGCELSDSVKEMAEDGRELSDSVKEMAEDGRELSDSVKEMAEDRREFSDSVKESDIVHDFPCSPCERNGGNIEGVKFCVECNENMCTKCLSNHNVLAMSRLHTVMDHVQTCQAQTNQLPSQRCSKHGGKIIDVFCPTHDIVGCSTCISVDHSSCTGKTLVTDVAAGMKTSNELKQLETEMKTVESKLDYLKKMKDDNLLLFKQDKAALKKQIKVVRKKMNEELDRMEKELEDKVDVKFTEKIDTIRASITKVDDMLAKIKHGLNQIKSDANDADIFVSCKMAKQEMAYEIYPAHAIVEKQPPERSFELHTEEYTRMIIEENRMFASLKQKFSVQSAEYQEDINISVSDDNFKCMVGGTCALPDGCLVMADFRNKKLKKLDPAINTVSTLINLPDTPFDICLVDDTCLAVSLINQKKIQFVSLSDQVKLDNSFSVGDRCRSLAHCDGLLYVCCGGSRRPESNEGRGHVEVYNCNGELLRCLYEEISCPTYISVINREVAKATCTGNDQVCIGEYSTGNIYIETHNDKRILIKQADEEGKPSCVYFDVRSSQLFVTLDDCDVIKVFQLKI